MNCALINFTKKTHQCEIQTYLGIMNLNSHIIQLLTNPWTSKCWGNSAGGIHMHYFQILRIEDSFCLHSLGNIHRGNNISPLQFYKPMEIFLLLLDSLKVFRNKFMQHIQNVMKKYKWKPQNLNTKHGRTVCKIYNKNSESYYRAKDN